MKIILAIVLAVVMVAGMAPVALADGFADTGSHWAESSIDRWASSGIVEGIGNNEFNPDGSMTRAQAAAMFVRLLKLSDKADISGYNDMDPDAWYADHIAMCVAAGIMEGVGDGLMNPRGTITREQMMVMLCRAVGIAPAETSDKSFADSNKVSDWAEGYVNALVNADIVEGIGSNTMAPQSDINRASMMALLDKGIAVYASTEGETVQAEEGATGIVLVAAPNVTVTGEASGIAIVEGAAGGTTTISDATVGTVTVTAAGTDVVLGGNTTAETVDVAEKAEGSSLKVEETAAAGTVTSAAPESNVNVEGAVEEVKVASTATNTTVETGSNATIGKVDTAGDGTTVSGKGTVENVATSGNNTNVQTDGTKVEAAEGTTGTVAGKENVEGGGSTTTETTHEHKFGAWRSTEDGKHYRTCACGTKRTSECTYVEGVCSKCGYIDGAEAKIGTTYYATLAEAFEVGGNITLLNDVVLEDALVVATGKTVTLDLNGMSITHSKAQTTHYAMISNYGTLTIKDSAGGGKISYTDTGSGGEYYSNTILNEGSMLVEGGTLENLSSETVANNGYPYVIDSHSTSNDASLIIKNGSLVCTNYCAIRIFANNTDKTNSVSVIGGTLEGGVEFQNPNRDANKGSLTVSGGTFNESTRVAGIYGFAAANADCSNMVLSITGGTFNDNINITNSMKNATGFNRGFITGGTFSVDPSAYVASGYKATQSNGKWTISQRLPGEVLTAAEAQEALDNATSGTVIRLVAGVDYGSLKFRANPEHSNTTQIEVANAYAYDYVRSIENITIIGADGAKVDGFIFETGAKPGDWHVTMDIKNLVIDGVEFTDVLTASSAGYNAPIFITTSNATVDGLTVKNCKLIGNNNKLNLVYLYGADGAKNVTLTANTVDGIARLCEIRGTENVTITGNTIKNTYEHGMLLAGSGYSGNIIITGNTAEGNNDRFVRMAGAADATIVITGNTITNYKGGDLDYIKVTGATGEVSVDNNTITDGTDGNRNFTVTIG